MDKELIKLELLKTLKSKGWDVENVGLSELIDDLLKSDSVIFSLNLKKE